MTPGGVRGGGARDARAILDDAARRSSPMESEARYAAHRARRARTVAAPQGALSLEATVAVRGEGMSIDGVPGLWSALTEARSGLRLTATAADGITADGVLVAGTVDLDGAGCAAPAAIDFADGRRGSIIQDVTGASALRVWNQASAAIARFGGISAHPYDPSWAFEARVEATPGRTLGVRRVRFGDAEYAEDIPAEIVFEYEGREIRLLALQESAGLLITFADALSGSEAYGLRFLMLTPRRDGTVLLDFNRAYLPPCAFSLGFNCPVPPAQNRLPFAVTAGEKQVLDASGAVLAPGGVFV